MLSPAKFLLIMIQFDENGKMVEDMEGAKAWNPDKKIFEILPKAGIGFAQAGGRGPV
jgi:hypothetical protein